MFFILFKKIFDTKWQNMKNVVACMFLMNTWTFTRYTNNYIPQYLLHIYYSKLYNLTKKHQQLGKRMLLWYYTNNYLFSLRGNNFYRNSKLHTGHWLKVAHDNPSYFVFKTCGVQNGTWSNGDRELRREVLFSSNKRVSF